MESKMRKELMDLLVREEQLKKEFYSLAKEPQKDKSFFEKLQETFRIGRKGIFHKKIVRHSSECMLFWHDNLKIFKVAALDIGNETIVIHAPLNNTTIDFDNEEIAIGFRFLKVDDLWPIC